MQIHVDIVKNNIRFYFSIFCVLNVISLLISCSYIPRVKHIEKPDIYTKAIKREYISNDYFEAILYQLVLHDSTNLQYDYVNNADIIGSQTIKNFNFDFPDNFNLENPFSPTSNIRFSISSQDTLKISYLLIQDEKLISKLPLLSIKADPGNYFIKFKSIRLPSGLYSIQFEHGERIVKVPTIVLK